MLIQSQKFYERKTNVPHTIDIDFWYDGTKRYDVKMDGAVYAQAQSHTEAFQIVVWILEDYNLTSIRRG